MSLLQLLPLVPALPLVGVVLLVALGRFLSGRAASWLATALVGLSFAVSMGIGAEYLTAGGDEPEPVVQRLWTWMAVGEDVVEVTATVADLPLAKSIPASAVIRAWAPVTDPRVAGALPDMWDADAVVGLAPTAGDVPRGSVLTVYNVPPGPSGFVAAASPRTMSDLVVHVSLLLDGLSLVMMLVVTGVGFLIHVFAVGYMAHDPDRRRFFTYMSLFVFSMLVLVLAADFLVLFVGWELVGLCSYLLIGFWYRDHANASAGRKAFIVNRVGDFAFLLGLMLMWSAFGSLAFADVLPVAGERLAEGSMLAVAICALLLVGATGKSAQLPLFVWLPDAMAGPTPVSALIHAATMVTAGVYMIARAHALFERAPLVMAAVAIIGGATALLAAAVAVVQVDIKRVLAYSTISQLGYMFLAVGAGAYVAGVFHLVTHAFFKALLFLAAGSVMHAVAHGAESAGAHPAPTDGVPPEQDMRQMGGLLDRLPLTGWSLVVGGLALAGLFPLAGFWSKDEVLLALLERGGGRAGPWAALYVVGLVTAFLTAFYAGRQLLLVLAGAPRSEGARRAAESPAVMTAPLVALAAASVLGGALGIALAGRPSLLGAVLEPVVGSHAAEGPGHLVVALVATATAIAGLVLAALVYGPRRVVDPGTLTARAPWLHRLAWNGFYVDALYRAGVVRPFRSTSGFLWRVVDDGLIDGAVNAVGRAAGALAVGARRTQTGLVRTYLLGMLLGAVALAAYLILLAR